MSKRKEKTFTYSIHTDAYVVSENSSRVLSTFVTLKKYFLHPSSIIYSISFPTPTKTGTSNRWENTKRNPPGPIIMINPLNKKENQ
jgi:hypothetical protein